MKTVLVLSLLALTGCLTVTAPNGTRIMATGNAKVTVVGDRLSVENSGTAETYQAIAAAAGQAAGIAAKTAVKP